MVNWELNEFHIPAILNLFMMPAMHAGSGSSRLGRKIFILFYFGFISEEKIITNKTIFPSKGGIFDWQFSATIAVTFLNSLCHNVRVAKTSQAKME